MHSPKTINVRCVYAPYRALITSRKVCALGALRFSSIARVANSRICTVAPEAYQKGPETPYLYATPDDCSSVAAHVHDDTTADATNPVFTVRPAVLNISDVCTSFWYLYYQNFISLLYYISNFSEEWDFGTVSEPMLSQSYQGRTQIPAQEQYHIQTPRTAGHCMMPQPNPS